MHYARYDLRSCTTFALTADGIICLGDRDEAITSSLSLSLLLVLSNILITGLMRII